LFLLAIFYQFYQNKNQPEQGANLMNQSPHSITESLSAAVTVFGAEWVMWLLIGLSVISLSLVIERLVFFWRHKVEVATLASRVAAALEAGDFMRARILAVALDRNQSLEVAVATEMIGSLARGSEYAEQKLRLVIARERPRYERGLSFLGTLGNNAPFIGLFGTVLGIIKAFSDLAASGGTASTSVMAGISEALVATAVGLLVALPAVMMFNVFKGKVQDTLRGAEFIARTLLDFSPVGHAASHSPDAGESAKAEAPREVHNSKQHSKQGVA